MKTKKQKIVSAIATIGIVITLFGATYAYFVSRTDAGKTTDIEITANTVDVFSFETGDAVSISIDQENFASGTGNQTGETFARAILSANNKTNTATEHYYLFLNIESNSFTYSKDSDHPEILVKITDSDGKELVDSDIDGLTHKTVVDAKGNTVTGFDVTTKTGMVTILNNREITTTSTKTENWTFTVTFVNYDFNQADNAGNNFKASVMIQKELLLAQWVEGLYTGVQGENNLYYHNGTILDDSGNVIDANDGSYRYGGASETTNNYICFGSEETTCPEDNLYRIIGVFDNHVKLVKATYAGSNLLGTNGTYVSNNTYKFSNYSSCPSETAAFVNNGSVIKLANKNIIAAGPAAAISCNKWKYSELNTVNLNTNYLNSFDELSLGKISDTIWTEENNETQKIGLISREDYKFMFSREYWNLLYEGEYQNNNWFYQIITYESPLYIVGYVTISKAFGEYINSIYSKDFFDPNYAARGKKLGGEFDDYGYSTGNNYYIKPSFYLNSDVTVSGSHQGTSSDPIRIN